MRKYKSNRTTCKHGSKAFVHGSLLVHIYSLLPELKYFASCCIRTLYATISPNLETKALPEERCRFG